MRSAAPSAIGQPGQAEEYRCRESQQQGRAADRALQETGPDPGDAEVVGNHDRHQQQVPADDGAGHLPEQRGPAGAFPRPGRRGPRRVRALGGAGRSWPVQAAQADPETSPLRVLERLKGVRLR